MRVLVFGGRDYQNSHALAEVLEALHAHRPITTVIHGGARGADAMGAAWANLRGVDVVCYPADWSRGKGAGPARNQRMLDEGQPDIAVECPGGRGTADMHRRIVETTSIPIVYVERPA